MPLILLGGFGSPPLSGNETVEVDSVYDAITKAGGYWGTADPLYWLEDATYSHALRFHGLDMPEGATVTTATLTVTRRTNALGATSNDKVSVGVEQVADPARLSSLSDHGTRSSNIGSTIDWEIGAGAANTDSTSPELKTIVQTVVDKLGFSGSIMFFVTPSSSVDNPGIQTHSYYTGSSGSYPTLHVEWTV